MKKRFEVEFLDEAVKFIGSLDEKARNKIIYNIDKSTYHTDPKLFKKLTGDIWEFRTRNNKKQYRLFAFWDKSDGRNILVITTYGIVKKTSKIDKKEIKKAEQLKLNYLLNKK